MIKSLDRRRSNDGGQYQDSEYPGYLTPGTHTQERWVIVILRWIRSGADLNETLSLFCIKTPTTVMTINNSADPFVGFSNK